MKRFLLSVAGTLLIQTASAQSLRTINWRADLDTLAAQLPAKHYNLYSVKSPSDFTAGLERIRAQSDKLTDFRVALKIQQLIASCGDSHTRLDFMSLPDGRRTLPLKVYWFAEGMYVLAAAPDNSPALGCRIVSVGGVPFETVADSLSTLISADNRSLVRSAVSEYFPVLGILEHFGFATPAGAELEVQDASGNRTTCTIRPEAAGGENLQRYKTDSTALCYKNREALFTDTYLPADKTCYLQYNRCWSRELEVQYREGRDAASLPSFGEFESRALQTLDTEPVDKIVFDLRFNPGGNSYQGTLFIEKLAKYCKKKRRTKVYVVLGRATFSSAILNAMDFKRIPNVVYVGEETGGMPNHFGEVRGFMLPSSELYVQYSTKYFRLTEEDVHTIAPDVRLEPAFSDFAQGVDPVYEWIKKQ